MKKSKNKYIAIILAAAVILALIFVFVGKREYNDGLEELSSDGTQGSIHKNYSSMKNYLGYNDALASYILSSEHIVVATAGKSVSDSLREFEITDVIKGNLTVGKAELADDPSVIGLFFRENDRYVLFLDAYLYPNPYAVFNVSEKTAHSGLKDGALLFDELPRNSERLISSLKGNSALSTWQSITNLHISSNYPPEVVRERSTMQNECKVKKVILLDESGTGKNLYRIYAEGTGGELDKKPIAFDQVIDSAAAKSIKGKSYTGYFDRYPIDTNKIIGFLDVERYMQ